MIYLEVRILSRGPKSQKERRAREVKLLVDQAKGSINLPLGDEVFSVKPNKLKAYLNLYPQQNEGKIKNFWSDLTDIPLANFGKTFIKPISKNFKKNNLYFGTMRIYVPRSTDLKYTMLGWLKALLQDLDPDVKLVQKRWSVSRKNKRPVNLEDITGPIAQR